MDPLRAAVIQLSSGADKQTNYHAAAECCREAADVGARLALLPEVWNAWVGSTADLHAAEPLDGPTATFMAQLAAETGMWLAGGSILEVDAATGRRYNTTLVFDAAGRRVAEYRKLHLFDVNLEGRDPRRESDLFHPGDRVASADTPWGRLGLTICYDLRFPELYGMLSRQGATMLAAPAAFSSVTGPDHWRTLLRARAIENQAFVLAADQCGQHPDGRESYGHSMIVDPWGEVLCELNDEPGVATAELDFVRLRQVRRELPCLEHRRIDIAGRLDTTEQ